MLKVFAFGFETRSKTISSLIYRLINEVLLVVNHILIRCQLMDWFLINMFLRFGLSRCLYALVHWCGFHAARDDSHGAYYFLLCLAAQTVAAIHLSNCWWLLLSSAPRVHKSTELLWHKTPDFTPDMRPPNRPDLIPVDYRIWTVIQECVYQKHTSSISCGY